ncbi:MAG: pyridoxal phosphate-dependent aminotransferase [Deltaproteobacteria bacterium]|nr:pyridoxal phosphate-dependent aminotransferase [Deltaproteobacteria bacterium]
MTVALGVQEAMKSASWIRRMFEAGQALKEQVGADQVFDFSLGNPVLEPPEAFASALRELTNAPPKGMHRYMPNAGFPSTRQCLAQALSEEQQQPFVANDVIMTVGAAGALNVALRTVLDPGDQVIVIAPYFVEYLFYVGTHGGEPRVVRAADDFDLDLAAIEQAITPKTKAIIVNTPNNPTGRIYTPQRIAELAALLERAEQRYDRSIYLLFDTPYAKITYDGRKNPPLFSDHKNTLLAHSHSKDLGLAGERIGYLAISPRAEHRSMLSDAAAFNNRVLGFINAPAIMQLALERSLGATVDVASYRRARKTITEGLRDAGYQFASPEGAFYLFPRCPIEDDLRFTEILREQHVLVVPGRGFGWPGYIRVAFCVEHEVIERALPRFADAFTRARQV